MTSRTSRIAFTVVLWCAFLGTTTGEDGDLTSCSGDIPEMEATLNSINYFTNAFPTPSKALVVGASIAIISATPTHLQDLLDQPDAVAAFTAKGGWILLNGLTPEGLAPFDSLVGFPHLLRKFRSEKVALAASPPHIAHGLQAADLGMRTVTNPYIGDFIVASDAYSWVVDTDNLAPFAQLPDFSWFHHPDNNNDKNPYNLVDGFLSNDSWKRAFALYPSRSRMDFTMTMPKSMAIAGIDVTTSFIYAGITHIEFTFDGNEADKLLLTTPIAGPAHLQLDKPLTATTIKVRVVDWKDTGRDVIGIDEIRISPVRDQTYFDRVKPITDIGAIVAYPRDRGGILLCQLAFPEQDQDFSNQQRRRNILAILMRNSGASPGRRETNPLLIPPPPTIAMGNPCELGAQAIPESLNPAWIDPALAQPPWPRGIQSFGGIGFSLGDKPQALVRHVNDAPGIIHIAQGVRALVFLQLSATTLADGQLLGHYTVVYSDGRRVVVPIVTGYDIATYRQLIPRSLPRAQLAWVGANADPKLTEYSVLYSRQWNNPTPGTPIDHIEVVCDQSGSSFAVLGVTTLPADVPGKS